MPPFLHGPVASGDTENPPSPCGQLCAHENRGYHHPVSLADAWEANAGEWITWARSPAHDEFWDGTWPELRAVLPEPAGLTIDVGCGEGRASRQLMAAGHTVVAVERSSTLARAARSGTPRVT